jgi:hypothetical protein
LIAALAFRRMHDAAGVLHHASQPEHGETHAAAAEEFAAREGAGAYGRFYVHAFVGIHPAAWRVCVECFRK